MGVTTLAIIGMGLESQFGYDLLQYAISREHESTPEIPGARSRKIILVPVQPGVSPVHAQGNFADHRILFTGVLAETNVEAQVAKLAGGDDASYSLLAHSLDKLVTLGPRRAETSRDAIADTLRNATGIEIANCGTKYAVQGIRTPGVFVVFERIAGDNVDNATKGIGTIKG